KTGSLIIFELFIFSIGRKVTKSREKNKTSSLVFSSETEDSLALCTFRSKNFATQWQRNENYANCRITGKNWRSSRNQ
ncbi:MAG: hypothetical protein K5928_07110, partial [Prevotella sp.]|nr:hypothetical protein [Prevotella sp.]